MLATTAGRVFGVVLLLAALSLAGWSIAQYFKADSFDEANSMICIDSETGQSFKHRKVEGESIPFLSPQTDRNTAYPAEMCYWNADGSLRKEPFPVLLNSCAGKQEPTFCPDCGRLVRGHNPVPRQGSRPPPTEAEYNSNSWH